MNFNLLEIAASFIPPLVSSVIDELAHAFRETEGLPDIEVIQDVVERQLVEAGHFDIAKNYILYRAERARRRAEKRIEELEKIDKNVVNDVFRSYENNLLQKGASEQIRVTELAKKHFQEYLIPILFETSPLL